MKYLILMLFTFSVQAQGFKTCASWDTFCKSPPQLVATKCRLGVPVYRETCESLGINRGMYARNYSLVAGLPVSEVNGRSTQSILEPYIK